MRFENESVIITGGRGKIAKAYAMAFAREGATDERIFRLPLSGKRTSGESFTGRKTTRSFGF